MKRGLTVELNWRGMLVILATYAILVFALGFECCGMWRKETEVVKFTGEEIDEINYYRQTQDLVNVKKRDIVVYKYSDGRMLLGLEVGD